MANRNRPPPTTPRRPCRIPVVTSLLLRVGGTAAGRFLLTFFGLLGGLGVYFGLNGAAPARLHLMTGLDEAIPFLPWTLVVYHSYYVLPLAVVLGATAEEFVLMYRAALVGVLATFACFLLVPAEFTRPDWTLAGATWGPAFRWLHGVDGPANTFPSLHVEVTVLTWYRARTWPSAPLWSAWAGLVVLSTMTTKQHLLADVVGGIVVALAASKWAERGRIAG